MNAATVIVIVLVAVCAAVAVFSIHRSRTSACDGCSLSGLCGKNKKQKP